MKGIHDAVAEREVEEGQMDRENGDEESENVSDVNNVVLLDCDTMQTCR
jgi:hypothetical protein